MQTQREATALLLSGLPGGAHPEGSVGTSESGSLGESSGSKGAVSSAGPYSAISFFAL